MSLNSTFGEFSKEIVNFYCKDYSAIIYSSVSKSQITFYFWLNNYFGNANLDNSSGSFNHSKH